MWKGTPLKGFVIFSISLSLATIIAILVTKNVLPPSIPLFYGLPVSEDQLIPTIFTFFIPIIGLAITLLNVFISSLAKDLFIKKALIISGAFVSLLITITIIKVIFLVGFFNL